MAALLNRRSVRFALIIGLVILAWVYWGSLQEHGTFAPLFSLYYTSSAPYAPMSRPAGWKPKSRVVVSLTTMPRDVDHLDEVLYSISNQTVQPDVIYVNLPVRNRRNGQPYIVPDWLETFPKVQVLRPETDYGPLTKLFPALEAENDPDTIIVTFDDDKVCTRAC